MKKIITIVLSIIMISCFTIMASAAEVSTLPETSEIVTDIASIEENASAESRSIEYRFTLKEVLENNYYNYFTVPSKGIFNYKRTVYLVGAIKFSDGVQRDVKVRVGEKVFTVRADGVARTSGTVDVSTEMPVMFSIEGITSTAVAVFNVYTLD